jgi:hypothetical protein
MIGLILIVLFCVALYVGVKNFWSIWTFFMEDRKKEKEENDDV